MRPDFEISGLSAAANDRLLSLTVTESTQGKSDSATFTLDDRDYLLEVPRKGQIITVMIGYKETGLSPAGEYRTGLKSSVEGYDSVFDGIGSG